MAKPTRRDFLKSMGLGAVAAIGTFAYGDEMSKKVELVERDLALPNWNADGFRIAVVSDCHLDSREATVRAQRVILDLIAKKPDAMVFVGDFLTSAAPQNLANVHETLALLNRAQCPAFGVLGNHDYWAGYFSMVLGAISNGPMKLLRNETVEVDGVRICGIDDALMGKHRPDLAKGDRNTILLLHEPPTLGA
jgi:predicted MPP superfamily phosphohydrolase